MGAFGIQLTQMVTRTGDAASVWEPITPAIGLPVCVAPPEGSTRGQAEANEKWREAGNGSGERAERKERGRVGGKSLDSQENIYEKTC